MWWAACGAYDRDLRNRAFWMSSFGTVPTAEQLIDMHPLRRLEKPPPTPEAVKAAADMGWAILGKGLAALNAQRKG